MAQSIPKTPSKEANSKPKDTIRTEGRREEDDEDDSTRLPLGQWAKQAQGPLGGPIIDLYRLWTTPGPTWDAFNFYGEIISPTHAKASEESLFWR